MKKHDCLKYVITYASNNEYYHITPPAPSQKYMNMVNNINYDPLSFIPQIFTNKTINHYVELARTIHPTAVYTGHSNVGWRFSYKDRNEPCYTGTYHDSNGFYVCENKEKGIIYMKCMSDDCNSIKILEKTSTKKTIPLRKLF
jgi:hypothetical protein